MKLLTICKSAYTVALRAVHQMKTLAIRANPIRAARIDASVRMIAASVDPSQSAFERDGLPDTEQTLAELSKHIESLVEGVALLRKLELTITQDWIPRLSLISGVVVDSDQLPAETIRRGSDAVTAVESVLLSAIGAEKQELNKLGAGLARIHEWLFLAQKEADPQVNAALAKVVTQVAQLMDSLSIETLISEGHFRSDTQAIAEVRPTSDMESDMKVCETLRPGYAWRGVLLKREQVVVLRHHKQ
jgi:hypothetical protein